MAKEQALSTEVDTVVIGAGVAGLGAAALLARDFGQKVLVCERAPFIARSTSLRVFTCGSGLISHIIWMLPGRRSFSASAAPR